MGQNKKTHGQEMGASKINLFLFMKKMGVKIKKNNKKKADGQLMGTLRESQVFLYQIFFGRKKIGLENKHRRL